MGQESTQMIQENFADVIKLMCDASTDGNVTEFQTKYGYQSFRTIITPDMSARWKGLDKGGAAKIRTEFCDCCECNSNTLATQRHISCQKWCKGDNLKKCYHWEMATEEMLSSLKNDASDLLQKWGVLEDDTLKNSKVKFFEENDENNLIDPFSINFQPISEDDVLNYANFLSEELNLRGMGYNLQLGWEQRRAKLLERVLAENEIKILRSRIERCQASPKALYLMIQAIPCILHLEMRVGLKILTMIINAGLGNASAKKLTWQDLQAKETSNQRKDDLAQTVEKVINEFILGTEAAPGQFKLKFERDHNTGNQHVISQISLANSAVRSIINDINLVIDKLYTG